MKFIGLCLLCAVGFVAAVTCPPYTKKTAIIGNQVDLPDGFLVFGIRGGQGIYRSPLRSQEPALIPNTGSDKGLSIDLSPDGEWLVYSSSSSVYVIGSDGSHRTRVPTRDISVRKMVLSGVYRQSPKGTEIFYKETDNRLRAIQMTWGPEGPTFGTDRLLGEFGSTISLEIGIARNHMFTRLGTRTEFVTIPDGGNGVARDGNKWSFTGSIEQGCYQTISFDGSLCCHNPGFLDITDCIPTEIGGLRHRGFMVLPFKEETDPSMNWVDFVMQGATSINWCPSKYWVGGNFDVDFLEWRFTNDNSYVAGSLRGPLPDAESAWLVHWQSNTWTELSGSDHRVMYAAVHFGDPGNGPTPVPDQPPVVSLIKPDGAATLPKTAAYGAIQAEAHDPDIGTSDGDGIERVVFLLLREGAVIATHTENGAPYEWGLSEVVVDGGEHTIRAIALATPSAGGGADTVESTVTIENPQGTGVPLMRRVTPTVSRSAPIRMIDVRGRSVPAHVLSSRSPGGAPRGVCIVERHRRGSSTHYSRTILQ